LKLQGIHYRAHDPKWAFDPLSGDGARAKGGRFNPIGMPALYLARSPAGCFVEQSHGFPLRFSPLTVCAYDIDVDDIVKLTTGADRTNANVSLSELQCAWMDDVRLGRTPASWNVATRLIASGAAGILVPSFAYQASPNMHNVVLWRWGDSLPHKVSVHDPNFQLPKNQDSWR
jgi:RES domain-containing protein